MQSKHESKETKVLLWRRSSLWFLLGCVVGLYILGFHSTSAQAQQFLFKIPQQPSFKSPQGVAIAPNGLIWVADSSHHQVVRFDPNNPGVETRIGSFGFGDGQFNFPEGVALDSLDNVYVVDTGNHRIQVFGPSP
jgi:sugar lactone lactonase YvrE